MMAEMPHLTIGQRKVSNWVIIIFFLVASLLAYVPYLNIGFSADDFIFINMLEGAIQYNQVLGFWYGDIELYPGFNALWWMEPGLTGAFLRPLPSWTLTLHYQAFSRNAIPYHLTLVIIHGLVAFTAFLVLQRLSRRIIPALLAAILFLICEDHAMTVAWITTLTDLMCVLCLNLAFLSHIIARQDGKRWPFWLSLLLFLAALASKETAVVYPIMIIAFEFVFADTLDGGFDQMSLPARIRTFLHHWWAWGIPMFILSAYMILYRSLVPPMRNLMYIDPFSQPFRYLVAALTNLPVMFVGLLSQFLPSLVVMLPATLPIVIAAGVILMILLFWALLPDRHERTVWFALFVFVLGLLPGLATDPGERLLYFPTVFGLYVVAWLILQIPFFAKIAILNKTPAKRTLRSVYGWYLLISALILPLFLLFVYPSMWIPGLQLPEKTVLNSLGLIDQDNHKHVIYLNTDSSFNTFYLPDIYRYHRGEYIDLRMLSSFNGHMWAKQESDRVLVLKTEDEGWLNNIFARTLRLTPVFSVGEKYSTALFTATIMNVMPDGKDVKVVRFEFEQPLDEPSIVILYYDGETFRRWEPSQDWQLLNLTLDPFAF
jgi:hypothetical protein